MELQELSKEELVKHILCIRKKSKELMKRKEKADELIAKIVILIL